MGKNKQEVLYGITQELGLEPAAIQNSAVIIEGYKGLHRIEIRIASSACGLACTVVYINVAGEEHLLATSDPIVENLFNGWLRTVIQTGIPMWKKDNYAAASFSTFATTSVGSAGAIQAKRISIEDIKPDIPLRIYHVLRREGIDYLDELTGMSDEALMSMRNMGKTSLMQLREICAERSIKLADAEPESLTKPLRETTEDRRRRLISGLRVYL